MPRIINAYADNSSLANSLKDLGEAMFGDQAKNEVYRQTAFGKKRENDNIPLLADAVARGDRDAIARLGVMSNKTGQDAADFNRLAVSNHAAGVDDPRMALATMGAGGSFTSTAPGQGRALANDRSIAGGHDATTLESQRIASDRAAATQLAIDGRTLAPVGDGNGGFVYDTKSHAVGREAPMTTDQVKAGVIARALRGVAASQQPQGFPANGTTSWDASAAPAPQPAKPQGDIFAGMTPQVRALVGVNSETPMVDPRSGQTGVSRDNGTTLENGQPAAGYLPVSPDARLAQERDNNVRTQAAAPLPSAPTAYPDVAKDAALTSGPKSFAQKEVNDLSGTFGLGEAFPGVNRARENLANQAQATRELIANAPGRAAVMDKKWADELIPQPGWFGVTGINATEQANRSVSLTNHLRNMYTMVQQDATDPNTPPAERVKMAAYLRNLGNVIQMREKVTPAAGAAPAAGAPQQAPQQAAQPPVAGAAQAPDGHWYVKQGGQYFRVDQ
jgi:hypothetical protein